MPHRMGIEIIVMSLGKFAVTWTGSIVVCILCSLAGQYAVLDVLAEPTASAYTVHGVLHMKTIRYSDQKSFYYDEIRYGFETQVDDCKWLAKLSSPDPMLYDYRIVSSDGVDSYLLLSYETRQRQNLAKGIATKNFAGGTVMKGPVPCFDLANEAGTIWLAYASACYFAQHSRDETFVVPYSDYVRWFATFPGAKLVFERAALSLNDSPPYLPEGIAYYFHPVATDSGRHWAEAPDSGPGGLFTNVNYRVLSFTNFGGIRIPREVLSLRFRPDQRELPNIVPQLCEEIRLTTTNITPGVSFSSFRPKLPGITDVMETRFANGTRLMFNLFATNDWPSEADAKNSRAYKEALARLQQTAALERRKSSRLPAAALMVCLIALPVVLWFLTRKSGDLLTTGRTENN